MCNWQRVWPGATVAATPKGSITAELFSEAVVRWEKEVRERWPQTIDKVLVLIVDTGGGALFHPSVEFVLITDKKKIRPFYLKEYHTKALMPLDQTPNLEASKTFQSLRRDNGEPRGLRALGSLAR